MINDSLPIIDIEQVKLSECTHTMGNIEYSLTNILELCKERKWKPFKLPLSGINLATSVWDLDTIEDFIWHCNRARNADYKKYPIILNSNGAIADGWHRVCAAILNKEEYVMAIRMTEMPTIYKVLES